MLPSDLVGEFGAYGLRVHGLEEAERWMQEQPPAAPELDVHAAAAAADRSPSQLDGAEANLALLDGGRLRARNGEAVVRFSLPVVPSAADLLHPYLAPAAALVWQWAGHEALHAGAVQVGAGALLMFGVKESGKSTLLAWLARELGLAVLTDDLAVIDGHHVLAGPRSIDLRSVGTPSAGSEPSSVRGGARTRVSLPPAPPSTPVLGTALLEWGRQLEVTPVPAMRRIEVLAAQRTYPQLSGDPGALLDLAAHPMFIVSRQPRLDQLEATARVLVERFS
jgi:hypothetical protein